MLSNKEWMPKKNYNNKQQQLFDTISIDSRGGFDLMDGNPERRILEKKKKAANNKWAMLAESRKELLS
jgi:hypothetical protein